MAGSGNFFPKHSFIAPAEHHQYGFSFNPWWLPSNIPFGALLRLGGGRASRRHHGHRRLAHGQQERAAIALRGLLVLQQAADPAADDDDVGPLHLPGGAVGLGPGGRGGGDIQVHLVIPKSFNDAQQIADKFKEGIPVILNLQATDQELSKRLIDFASGLTYALDGGMQRVADFLTSHPAVGDVIYVLETNKASREMNERVAALVGSAGGGMPWLGTFHSICARMLRRIFRGCRGRANCRRSGGRCRRVMHWLRRGSHLHDVRLFDHAYFEAVILGVFALY